MLTIDMRRMQIRKTLKSPPCKIHFALHRSLSRVITKYFSWSVKSYNQSLEDKQEHRILFTQKS